MTDILERLETVTDGAREIRGGVRGQGIILGYDVRLAEIEDVLETAALEIAHLRQALELIRTEGAMTREQFILAGPAFACRKVEFMVALASEALDKPIAEGDK